MDRGADAWVANTKPPFEQGLRAEGADQRDVHQGGDDPPDTEAAGEERVNLTKQALRKSFAKLKWARKVALQGVGADLFASVGCRSAVKLWSLSGVHRIAKLSLRNCPKSSWSGVSTVNLGVYYGQEVVLCPVLRTRKASL